MNARIVRFLGLVTVWAAAAALVGGCSSGQSKSKPLTPQAFISPNAASEDSGRDAGPGESSRPALEVPANSVADRVNAALNRPAAADPLAGGARPTPAVGSAAAPVATTPTAAPVALGASGGQYLTLGGVVADVNGTPIHASKVLAMLNTVLREKAKQMPPERFKREAADLIRRQITELIRNELDYAAAKNSLDPDDRRLADATTIMWRIQQITTAGGSLEMARRASTNPTDPNVIPMDLDERTAEQQRVEMIRIYNQKKIVPRIQVSANEIREYYDRNVNLKFTTNERVQFRLIKVDINKTSDVADVNQRKEQAMAKVADKYKRAKAGEDFAAMAKRENDESMFAGDAAFDIAPSAFAIPKVVQALAKLNPGEVSDIIEDRDAFYIVKLESRTGGHVRPFDEKAVQDQIRATLRSEQYARLREQDYLRLTRNAIINTSEEMASIALDMAMQRYAEYAGK